MRARRQFLPIFALQASHCVVAAAACARAIGAFFTAALLCAALQAQPIALPKYIAGEHYQQLPTPVKTAAADKIEVMEIFWYGCSHCQDFEPLLVAWQKNSADDLVFARTPAVWQKLMRSHAALYYVAEALDLPHAIHNDLFNLLVKNRRLDDTKQFATVFAGHGVDEETFTKLYKSFGTISKVNRAEKRLRKNYLSQGTPELIVNGKYRVSSSMAGGQAEMIEVANFLIDLERRAAQAASTAQPAPAHKAAASS